MQFPIFRENNLIILPKVRIIGPVNEIKIDLLLDTGASYCTLSWKNVLELGYPRYAHRPIVSLATANGTIRSEIVALRQMQIDYRNLLLRIE